MKKKTLVRAKTINLIRLAKWLKLDPEGKKHYDIAEMIYFHLLYT